MSSGTGMQTPRCSVSAAAAGSCIQHAVGRMGVPISPEGHSLPQMLQGPFPLWRPDPATVQAANLAHFMSDFQVAALTLSSAVACCCSTACGRHEQCGFPNQA
jgi:hypothetical protein